MLTLGQTLKNAREKRKMTASQAAAATRIKIQHIQAMERDDFSKMAAPMYAKGFIKIYAEYLGLDPAPFIREYVEVHMPKERPRLEVEAPPAEEAAASPKARTFRIPWAQVMPFVQKWKKQIGAGALVLLVVVISMLRSCGGAPAEPRQEAAAPKPVQQLAMPLVRPPPEPYLEGTSPSAQTP
jgi:transcriptional regulator with XRE-family HTH domain